MANINTPSGSTSRRPGQSHAKVRHDPSGGLERQASGEYGRGIPVQPDYLQQNRPDGKEREEQDCHECWHKAGQDAVRQGQHDRHTSQQDRIRKRRKPGDRRPQKQDLVRPELSRREDQHLCKPSCQTHRGDAGQNGLHNFGCLQGTC